MSNEGLNTDRESGGSRRLTALYIAALSAIALLTIIGQVSVQWSLAEQRQNSTIVNIAGRQRMLSQKISKSALLLAQRQDAQDSAIAMLQRDLEEWQRAHEGLQNGNVELNLPNRNSSDVDALFREAAPHHQAMLAGAQQVIAGEYEAGIEKLLASEPEFLRVMDAIVFQYDREAQADVARLLWLERFLLFATLGVLVAEGWFVFRPAAQRIETTMGELVHAKQVAEEASAQKSRFLAQMSHDLRTPLNAILGLIDVMVARPNQEHKPHLETMRDAAEAQLALVSDLLDAARFEADAQVQVRNAPVDLPRLVQCTVGIFQQRAVAQQLGLKCVVENDVPQSVLTDGHLVQQVLMNLLSNALKFTDAGEITVKVASRAVSGTKHRVEIAVTDTGIGIAAEEQSRIFESFTQIARADRPRDGVGLGLHIVTRTAAALGGAVQVESEGGRGSTFRFHFPAVACDLPARVEPRMLQRERAWQVLLIEDLETNQLVCREMLEYLGHHGVVAATGEAGIAAARSTTFDLVLLDLQLPDLSGMEVVKRLRQLDEYRTTPIVAVSAHAFESHRREALTAGFSDFLCKPLRLPEIAAIVGRHVPKESHASTANLTRWQAHPSLLRNLVRLFASQWPQQLEELDAAISQKRVAHVQFVAHRLKGMAANFSDAQVQAAAAGLETAAQQGEVEAIPELRNALALALENLNEHLSETVGRDGAAS